LVQHQRRKSTSPNTKDEYDDTVISNIELTTDDEADDNYCLMFVRQKKEAFLTLNSRATDDIQRVIIPPISSTRSIAIPLPSLISIWQARETTLSIVSGTFKRECSDGLLDTFYLEK
jgi:hypothetical protein